MDFATYSRWQWGGFLVVTVGTLAFLAAILPPPLYPLIGLVALLSFPLGAISVWAHLSVIDRAIDDYGGTPMPGIWGWLGYDVTPEDEDEPDEGAPDVAPVAPPAPARFDPSGPWESADRLVHDLDDDAAAPVPETNPSVPPSD